ncbi:MAG: hypothetical protein R3E88_21555 [Myxococcota bacterium]
MAEFQASSTAVQGCATPLNADPLGGRTNVKLDREALRAACFAAARNTMWERRPVDVSSIEDVANRFFSIAENHEEFVAGQERDPNLIVRAVQYLAHTHAIPPMRSDTSWFQDMLAVLVELACPNCGATPDLETFFRDIEEGIAVSRSDYEQ